MPTAVVESIERRRPFIGAGDARRGGKKAQEEARSHGKKERERTVACELQRRVEEAQSLVREAQHRRDVSPAPLSPLRQSYDASFLCQ
jgi:hypothetical protein